MISRNITINNTIGLHAKAAAFFVETAQYFKRFSTYIWIENGDMRLSAQSLLCVISMAISKGTTVTLIADGPREADSIEALVRLIESDFDERYRLKPEDLDD